SNTPVPDVVALAATATGDGIANIPGPTGTGFFAVATANVGAGGPITVSATTIAGSLGLTLTVCQTDAGGNCLAAPASSVVVQIGAGQTPTFAVFITGSGPVPFDPANNRVVLLFKDGTGATRGATSVAVRTE